MTWSSKRRLPSDWEARRRKVKAKAKGHCQAKAHVSQCNGTGTDCDHIGNPDDHSLGNLQWLSAPCHAAKTRADNHSSKHLTLPTERHPGTL